MVFDVELRLDDLHLLHTIRAIEEELVFQAHYPGHCLPYSEACNWTTVLKGEALKRGLDWSKPPTRRVGLVSWLCEKTTAMWPNLTIEFYSLAIKAMNAAGLKEPQIDVSNFDGKPSYQHWNEDSGSPLAG